MVTGNFLLFPDPYHKQIYQMSMFGEGGVQGVPVSKMDFPVSADIDIENGLVYWIDRNAKEIKCANIYGNDPKLIWTIPPSKPFISYTTVQYKSNQTKSREIKVKQRKAKESKANHKVVIYSCFIYLHYKAPIYSNAKPMALKANRTYFYITLEDMQTVGYYSFLATIWRKIVCNDT